MTPAQPLVSIIVPCYNAAQWLSATLESALAQTWPRVEIIVVDDGSSDDSVAIAKRLVARGVRVESIRNSGAAAARNHGVACAQGEFLQFLDADDILAPDKLERQLDRLLPAGNQAVATCAWARFRIDPTEANFVAEPLWHDFVPIDWLLCSWRQHLMMATAAWLVPRALAERAGSWNTTIGRNPVDDMEYFSRVLLASDRVLFCDGARVYYRSLITGSLSRQRSDEHWRAIFASFQLTADRLLEHENSPRSRLAVATALQQLVFDAYPRATVHRLAAERRVAELGGTDLRPDTGPLRRPLQRLIGWKATKRLHDLFHRRQKS
jgi:glycosyltransferase involved in cell wall biosynthesis